VIVRIGLCSLCTPWYLGDDYYPPTHCDGKGDVPIQRGVLGGVLGSGFRCSCDCRAAPAVEFVTGPVMATATDICAIGGVDDGTLRVCCSTHQHVLCAHHYARTHFVETVGEWHEEFACNGNGRKVYDLATRRRREST
jgi:hypothetical protein